MSAAVIQLLVLAGIAIFLILRLRSVLGTREGFEKPPLTINESESDRPGGQPEIEVIHGGGDHDARLGGGAVGRREVGGGVGDGGCAVGGVGGPEPPGPRGARQQERKAAGGAR